MVRSKKEYNSIFYLANYIANYKIQLKCDRHAMVYINFERDLSFYRQLNLITGSQISANCLEGTWKVLVQSHQALGGSSDLNN